LSPNANGKASQLNTYYTCNLSTLAKTEIDI
jgi:hypothetical protein